MKMNKKGQENGLIELAIALIIGIVILGAIWAFLSNNVLNTQQAYSESQAFVAGSRVILDNTPVVSIEGCSNDTWVTTRPNCAGPCNTTTALELNCNTTGTAFLLNYTYKPNAYISGGTTKTIVQLLPVAAALILFTAGGAYLVMKQ